MPANGAGRPAQRRQIGSLIPVDRRWNGDHVEHSVIERGLVIGKRDPRPVHIIKGCLSAGVDAAAISGNLFGILIVADDRKMLGKCRGKRQSDIPEANHAQLCLALLQLVQHRKLCLLHSFIIVFEIARQRSPDRPAALPRRQVLQIVVLQ